MSLRDDFLVHFRTIHAANRSEFFKHTSIVSVAGLGFNLIENRPMDFAWNWPSCFWALSTISFLCAILCVLLMFYVSSNHADAQYRVLNASGISEKIDEGIYYREKAQKHGKSLKMWGRVLFFAFTIAVLSAILVAVNNLFL